MDILQQDGGINEVMKQLLELFGDVVPFLDISPATRGKLLSILEDQQQKPYGGISSHH